MTAADVAVLLRALAAGRPLAEAAREAELDVAAASAALNSLADRQRPARKRAPAVTEPELPPPPATSPFPDGQLPIAYADGASRGNPGPAAYGCVYAVEGLPLCAEGVAIGTATNNVAEYRGAIAALRRLRQWGVERAVLRLDSQLVVKQLEGSYRVKDAKLRALHQEASALAGEFTRLRFEHVPRRLNELADRAANQALDG